MSFKRYLLSTFCGCLLFMPSASLYAQQAEPQAKNDQSQTQTTKDANGNNANKQGSAQSQRALSVYVISALDFTPYLELWGEVSTAAGGALNVVAETTAILQEIAPKARHNQYVTKDTLLFTLDDTTARLALAQAEAGLESAKSRLNELLASKQSTEEMLPLEQQMLDTRKQAFDRYQGLGEKNLVSNTNLENQLLSYIQAQQAVKNREASLKTLEAQIASQQSAIKNSEIQYQQALHNLEKTKITAPVDGKIVSMAAQEGQMVNTGASLLRMVNAENLEVQTNAPYAQFRTIFAHNNNQEAKNITATYVGDGDTMPVYLKAWPSEISTQSRQVHLQFAFESLDNLPLLGSYGRVKIYYPSNEKTILIPRDSIDQNHVYVMNEQGNLVKKTVEVTYIGTAFAIVHKGLEIGDKLIINPPSPVLADAQYRAVESQRIVDDIQQFIAQ